MIEIIIILILLSIATEAITEILTSSALTDPVRMWWKRYTYRTDTPPKNSFLQKIKVFIDKLISCGYCTSVWISGLSCVFGQPSILNNEFWNWVLCTFVVHRTANWLHVIYELVRKGRVKTHDLLVKVTIDEDELSEPKDELSK